MKTQSTSKNVQKPKSFYKPLVQTTDANKREGVTSSNVTSSKIESDQLVEKKVKKHII
jgi:hypothetical protein